MDVDSSLSGRQKLDQLLARGRWIELAGGPDMHVEEMAGEAEGVAQIVGRGIAARMEETRQRQEPILVGLGGSPRHRAARLGGHMRQVLGDARGSAAIEIKAKTEIVEERQFKPRQGHAVRVVVEQ